MMNGDAVSVSIAGIISFHGIVKAKLLPVIQLHYSCCREQLSDAAYIINSGGCIRQGILMISVSISLLQ